MQQAQPSTSALIYNRVRSLSLSHFRNYHAECITLEPGAIILVGPNGAGKTNLLEAVSLLAPGRGLRRATLSDMDNMQDSAPWAVNAEITGGQGEASVGTGRDPNSETIDKRIVRIDGKTARGQTELAKLFAALWLTPQMDTLFIEGGTARRKFLDRLVYSFDADHASRVNAYETTMRERNRLLAMGRYDTAWLAALEQKMAEQGVAIAIARAHAVDGLTRAGEMTGHSFPKAGILLSGVVEALLVQGQALAAEEQFKATLAQGRAQDAGAGRAIAGIHRTQVEVTHLGKHMKAERCSTGEQKALLVSIVLAQARAGMMWHGRVPALLLDEVATHLDATHRGELYAELTDIGAQVWLTGTDEETFAGLKGQVLGVKDGVVSS